MKKLLIIKTLMIIFFLNTVESAPLQTPNKLLDFVAQHSTEMALYMRRSIKPTKKNPKKSATSSPTTAEELAFISVKESALGGYVPAQDLLAYCYATGTGTKENGRLAFCWYLKAALEGSKSARDSLFACFEEGIGVTSDPQLCKLLKTILS